MKRWIYIAVGILLCAIAASATEPAQKTNIPSSEYSAEQLEALDAATITVLVGLSGGGEWYQKDRMAQDYAKEKARLLLQEYESYYGRNKEARVNVIDACSIAANLLVSPYVYNSDEKWAITTAIKALENRKLSESPEYKQMQKLADEAKDKEAKIRTDSVRAAEARIEIATNSLATEIVKARQFKNNQDNKPKTKAEIKQAKNMAKSKASGKTKAEVKAEYEAEVKADSMAEISWTIDSMATYIMNAQHLEKNQLNNEYAVGKAMEILEAYTSRISRESYHASRYGLKMSDVCLMATHLYVYTEWNDPSSSVAVAASVLEGKYRQLEEQQSEHERHQ